MVLKRSLRSYIFRRRLAGKRCLCNITIPWSRIKGGRPDCMMHDLPMYVWSKRPIHTSLSLPAFRKELLRDRPYYQHHVQDVIDVAMKRGEAFVLVTLNALGQCNWNHDFMPTLLYYKSLRLGWATVLDKIQTWPSVHRPHQGHAMPVLESLRSLASPLIRQEFRQPAYAKMLRAFAAQKLLQRVYSGKLSMLHAFRDGLAKTVTRYQWSLLGFWLTVRTKIHHWRRAYTFKPLPPFAPNIESLPLLVLRNPRFVPDAMTELSRALAEDTPVVPEELKAWVAHASPAHLGEIVTMYGRTQAWCELVDFFANLHLKRMTSELLIHILRTLEKAPPALLSSHTFKSTVTFYFHVNFACDPEAVCCLIRAHYVNCKHPAQILALFATLTVGRSLHNPVVIETLASLYLNRTMCLHMANTQWPSSQMTTFWESTLAQQMYGRVQAGAKIVIRRFILKAVTAWKQRKQHMAEVLQIAAAHTHAWNTLAIRWRYLHRPVRGECPICMETCLLTPLHGERRHGVCEECRTRVEQMGKCPICRTHLWTVSDASSISYTSDHDYEDPYYDDGEWHYSM